MKTVQPFTLKIEARKSLTIPEDFLSAIKLHTKMLPMYMPTRWGWGEPRTLFEPENINALLYANGNTDSIHWKRTSKGKARGFFMPYGRQYPPFQHSSVGTYFYETAHQTELLEYLKAASINAEGDFGFIDSVATEYFEFAEANFMLPNHSIDNPKSWEIFFPSHRLCHWLPDMPWAVVFGLSYVKMFGKEKLLATPAFKVEEIGENMVFIQLTEKMEDIHLQYEEVMNARDRAKAHLGREYFFNLEQGYSLEADFNQPYADIIEEQEKIEAKGGKVFTVPTFEFLP